MWESRKKEKNLTSQIDEYVAKFGQNKKDLDAYLTKINRLGKETKSQKEQMQDFNKEIVKVTLLKLQVEEEKERRKVLKIRLQEGISQKKRELDSTLTKIDKLKEWKKDKLLDDERKNNAIA